MTARWLLAAALTLSACAAPSSPTAMAAAPIPPYEREAFGDGWALVGHGCDTRDLVLARDLEPEQRRGCHVTGGTLRDPYTGVVVVGPARRLDVDHRVPLALAWREGAWHWTRAQRVRFANDPENLQATTAAANRGKGDQGLGSWLPRVDPCGYARRFDAVADHYGLVDPARDAQVARACR